MATSTRSAHETALAINGRLSSMAFWQMSNVRIASPFPPRAFWLSATVLTMAQRFFQRSSDSANWCMYASETTPQRHNTPKM